MDYTTLTEEQLASFLRTAPLHEVQAYHDWKLAQARTTPLQYFTCPTHGGVVSVYTDTEAICEQCGEPLHVIEAQKQSTTLSDTVSVPKFYNTDGSPVKFGPKTLVSRRATQIWGRKEMK